jgi:hypothetical protein
MEVSFGHSFKKTFEKKIKNTSSEVEFWDRLEYLPTTPLSEN